jgi:hypothetical protein
MCGGTTCALDNVSGQIHVPASLIPGKGLQFISE